MKKRLPALGALLASTLFGCTDQALDGPLRTRSKEERLGEVAQPISVPTGYYGYCSAQNGSNWYLVANSADNDPCDTALTALGSGATITRAGLWNGSGSNQVVVRCGIFRQTFRGSTAISDAAAWASGRSSCWFNITANHLPIFAKPWSTAPTIKTTWGDDLRQTGMSAGGCPDHSNDTLDHATHEIGYGDHTGYDFLDQTAAGNPSHNSTWSVRSVADGVVWYAGPHGGNGTKICIPASNGGTCMRVVYIRHYVGSVLSDTHESYISAYFHLDSIGSNIYEGAFVLAGDLVGEVGDSGTEVDHLHFAVLRLTNTSTAYRMNADDVLFQFNGNFRTDWHIMPHIDPFGWQTSTCPEPASQYTDRGAMSSDLWISGLEAPHWAHSNPTPN